MLHNATVNSNPKLNINVVLEKSETKNWTLHVRSCVCQSSKVRQIILLNVNPQSNVDFHCLKTCNYMYIRVLACDPGFEKTFY